MSRVKRGVVTRQKHKKIFELAKGYRGTRSRLIKTATEAVLHADAYAYHGRKRKKRDFRRLWITRINAAARMNGLTYSRLIAGLTKAGIEVNRKMLSELAISDPAGFTVICEAAKKA